MLPDRNTYIEIHAGQDIWNRITRGKPTSKIFCTIETYVTYLPASECHAGDTRGVMGTRCDRIIYAESIKTANAP